MIVLGLAIGLPWLDVSHTQGLGMRLRVIAFVPLALDAAIVLGIVLRYLRPLLARPSKPPAGEPPPRRFPVHAALGTALAAFVVALHTGGGPRTEGQVVTHPALVTSAQALVGRLPPDAVAIVPERHIAFMIAWYARVPVALRPEGIDAHRRWRVMPLAFIERGPTLDRASPARDPGTHRSTARDRPAPAPPQRDDRGAREDLAGRPRKPCPPTSARCSNAGRRSRGQTQVAQVCWGGRPALGLAPHKLVELVSDPS